MCTWLGRFSWKSVQVSKELTSRRRPSQAGACTCAEGPFLHGFVWEGLPQRSESIGAGGLPRNGGKLKEKALSRATYSLKNLIKDPMW
jgi:hypothetical protein